MVSKEFFPKQVTAEPLSSSARAPAGVPPGTGRAASPLCGLSRWLQCQSVHIGMIHSLKYQMKPCKRLHPSHIPG